MKTTTLAGPQRFKSIPEIDAWLERMSKRPQPVSTPPKPGEQVSMFDDLPLAHRKTWRRKLLTEHQARA
jgi:hypothetical protein